MGRDRRPADLDSYDELWDSDEVELLEADVLAINESASAYARALRGLKRDLTDLSYPRDLGASPPNVVRAHGPYAQVDPAVRQDEARRLEPTSRYYRLDAEGLSSTLRAGTGYERGSFMAPRPIHPTRDRVISVREAARLHSFPDWFRFHATKWHGFRQIGNALPPLLGRVIGAELVTAIGVAPAKPKVKVALGDAELLRLGTGDAAKRLGADINAVPSHKLRHRKRKRIRQAAA